MGRKKRTFTEQQESIDRKFGEAKDTRPAKSSKSLKVERFQKKSYKCPNFCWKKSEERNTYGQFVGPAMAYCKLVGKGCKITNCPLIKS